MGKALQGYLDIRFNKRKQKGGARAAAGVISRAGEETLPLFPREPPFTRCLRGRDIYLRAGTTKARNENMCWTQEASLTSLFLFAGPIVRPNRPPIHRYSAICGAILPQACTQGVLEA